MEKFRNTYRIPSARAEWWDYSNDDQSVESKNVQTLHATIHQLVGVVNQLKTNKCPIYHQNPNHYLPLSDHTKGPLPNISTDWYIHLRGRNGFTTESSGMNMNSNEYQNTL